MLPSNDTGGDHEGVVILEDDPTGTQCASDIRLLFAPDSRSLAEIFARDASVYLLTNTRAMDAASAVRRVMELLTVIDEAARSLGKPAPKTVLRGDSTLRGHIWPEFDAMGLSKSVGLFVPAFPDAGRITRDGVHLLNDQGRWTPMSRTEFADDPVFGFRQSGLPEFLSAGRMSASVTTVALDDLRASAGKCLVDALTEASDAEVIVPDIQSNDDLRLVAQSWRAASEARRVITRCGPPLAAILAGADGGEYRHEQSVRRLLVVCGSHTSLARRQLAALAAAGAEISVLDVGGVLAGNSAVAVEKAAAALQATLRGGRCAALTVPARRASHSTLGEGSEVMSALVTVVAMLVGEFDALVTKGGITAAEVAMRGLGLTSIDVCGQLLPGVAAWSSPSAADGQLIQAVVPGNIGDEFTVLDAARQLAPAIFAPSRTSRWPIGG